MAKPAKSHICHRIAQIRLELTGPRGKASFAKKLGLSPSTYDYYESSRVPPAELLVKIAERSGVDLYWLLTGKPAPGGGVSSAHPLVHRVAKLLADCPDAAAPLAAFLEILSGMAKFPSAAEQVGKPAIAPAAAWAGVEPATSGLPMELPAGRAATAPGGGAPPAPEEWIPILGRSAAGVAHFWREDDPRGVTMLDELVRRYCRHPDRAVRVAGWSEHGRRETMVQLIAVPAAGHGGPAEFVCAADIKARHEDAFALRVDGDSMAPDIRHGDIVVLSPSATAQDGRPAVVQLAGQIGVTCKLYRSSGDQVHLISINEQFAPQSFPASQVQWALAVLARVRP